MSFHLSCQFSGIPYSRMNFVPKGPRFWNKSIRILVTNTEICDIINSSQRCRELGTAVPFIRSKLTVRDVDGSKCKVNINLL